eukprot:5814784-Prymnesium_polylepis.1
MPMNAKPAPRPARVRHSRGVVIPRVAAKAQPAHTGYTHRVHAGRRVCVCVARAVSVGCALAAAVDREDAEECGGWVDRVGLDRRHVDGRGGAVLIAGDVDQLRSAANVVWRGGCSGVAVWRGAGVAW